MNLKAVFKGSLLSLILVIVALFTGALLVYFNLLSETTVSIIVFCASAVGVFISAYGVAKASEHRLLLNALGVAVIFSLVVLLISLIVNSGFSLHTRTLTLIGGAFAAAFLGALFGK